MTLGQLEATIASLAASLTGTKRDAADPAAPFALSGLDSIATVELAAAIEDATGLDLAPEVVADCGNAHALAARLLAMREGAPAGSIQTLDPFAGMLADSLLPPDVRPPLRGTPGAQPRIRAARRGSPDAGLRGAATVLLTGATGFLGRWIARELLETSSARLLCLVRSSVGDADARLARSLALAGMNRQQMKERVEILEGDLTQPRLGLAHDRFAELAARIDAVCHAGAAVNWIQSYGSLRAANVIGTLELLRLACRFSRPLHFVSSVSVCYSTAAPPEVDERFDPFNRYLYTTSTLGSDPTSRQSAPAACGVRPQGRTQGRTAPPGGLGHEASDSPELPVVAYLKGLHLGYARTKAVAEALVRQAGERGLPVTIHRPALISGHSSAPDFNRDDLLSLFVRGCIEMGAAPDLDWTLDVIPVDTAARRIVDLSSARGTFHLVHPRPRHWRECVLWMRLYGYPLRLIPFAAWLQKLEGDLDAAEACGSRHPLAPLRRFFAERPDEGGGLTRAQLYEDVRRTRARGAWTGRRLDRAAPRIAELDAGLLGHYFTAFRSAGHIPPPESPIGCPARMAGSGGWAEAEAAFDARFFTRVAGDTLGSISRATLLARGSRDSIVSELTAWRSRRPTGIFEYRLETTASDARRDVILKVKARDRDVMSVGEALARVCDEAVGRAYARWQDRVGFARSHVREIEIYRQHEPRFATHLPRLLGSMCDESDQTWALVLERIGNAARSDSTSHGPRWSRESMAAVIAGLASLQAVWYRREPELRRLDWIGFERSSASMADMSDLWTALGAHARPAFCAWADPSISTIHRRLIAGVGAWWRTLEATPRTLIHNDFNPRNVCLRRRPSGPVLCAYDWELATIGPPQRDLAELLCFVLEPDAADTDIRRLIDAHRLALERASAYAIDRDSWMEGFRCSLYDVLVDRLSMYALVHRIRRQPFLPRVVRTWRRLYDLFPLAEDA